MIAHRKTVKWGAIIATLVAFAAFGTTAINTVAKYVGVESDTVTLSVRKPRYTVIFDANGGTGMMANQEFIYGTEQRLMANSFEREDYLFRGWSKTADGSDSSFYQDEQGLTDLSSRDGDEVTLYAQWSRYKYYNAGPVTFGVDENDQPVNCINTDVRLFNEENIDKNFEITFDIDPTFSYSYLDTLMNAMDEGNNTWPGIVFRLNAANRYALVTARTNMAQLNKTGDVDRVVIKRYGGTLSIIFNDRETMVTDSSPGSMHNVPVSFGCSMQGDGSFWRPFRGTLTNMSVIVEVDNTYMVNYDANGGFGSMESQLLDGNEEMNLSKNKFLRREYVFAGWNTEADGSGDSYSDEQAVRNIAGGGSEITLYAMWQDAERYTVKFHANGGTGEMENRTIFDDSVPYALDANEFERDGYVFAKWNTEPDGSGKSYLNRQEVVSLVGGGEEISLYAIWAEQAYTYVADRIFPGSTSDFDNTGIALFSMANINKDFEISFDIKEALSTSGQATIASSMDESGRPWPGLVFRVRDASFYEIGANANNSLMVETRFNREGIGSVHIKRVNKILYICFNDGECEQVIDYTNIVRTFDSPMAFGASLKPDGTAQRPFKGTLANMSVIVYPEATSGGE